MTNFSTGNGYGFYKNGELISMLDWNNRSISDVLPTYRYIIENGEGNKLTADLDVGDAYYGGTSLILRGNLKQGVPSTIRMYSADPPVSDNIHHYSEGKRCGGCARRGAHPRRRIGTRARRRQESSR